MNTTKIQKDTKILGIMPVLGFGTWEITGELCVTSVRDAINMGYHHIDTAQLYNNEADVGEGIRESNTDRDELFVTTKIATTNLTPEKIKSSTLLSLKNLKVDYIDLLLIHWPTQEMDLKACIETIVELQEKKAVLHIGVSNFSPELFEQAIKIGPIINNQLKFTPYHAQFKNLEIAKNHKKIITAYSPLERGNIVNNTILKNIGKKYQKTAAQITLRWLIQLGTMSVIPKAQSNIHRKENMDIFDFELSEEDLNTISNLNNSVNL